MIVSFRLSSGEKARAEELAELEGVSIGQVAKRLLLVRLALQDGEQPEEAALQASVEAASWQVWRKIQERMPEVWDGVQNLIREIVLDEPQRPTRRGKRGGSKTK